MRSTATETVSVLMTDLVGSTAMAGQVGPDAAEQLRQEHFGLLRQAVEHTGGREVKNLGDGLMVVFASAVEALTCAVEMQQLVERRNRRAEQQLGVRIGVSLGDATTEDDDYFGEPVVESARLCATAEGGQIVASAVIRQIAGSREGLSFRALGGLALSGISEPVEAVELQWEPLPASGIALPERLRELPSSTYVGRDDERRRLAELWAQARGGSLRLVLIGGEAGVGKTRLASNLALHVRGDGATVLYGRCDEDLGVPHQPWAQAIGHLVNEARAPVLDAHVQRSGGDLARLVPSLGARVGELPPPRRSDAETERYHLYAAVAGLLQLAGEQEPVLLILDDLQWADQPTLSLLRHIAGADASMAVMIVATYRGSDLAADHPLAALLAELRRDDTAQRIALTGLGADDVLALSVAVVGHELDDGGGELAREITRETAGNPFFAGELLRHLTESGAIAPGGDGRWGLRSSIADLGLPESIREVVCHRVARLGEPSQQILTIAAVVGRTFDLELLDLLIELDEDELLDTLDKGARASLLIESRERIGRFSFAHALISHALYDSLGATRRARLHCRVAEALERLRADAPGERLVSELSEAVGSAGGSAAILAYHWRLAGDRGQAVDYLLQAAEQAARGGADAETVTLYNQALGLIPEDDARRRRDVQMKRAIAYARFTHALVDHLPGREATP